MLKIAIAIFDREQSDIARAKKCLPYVVIFRQRANVDRPTTIYRDRNYFSGSRLRGDGDLFRLMTWPSIEVLPRTRI